MADSTFTLYRGAAATSTTTLYTAPASVAVVVTNIVIANTSGSAQTATVSLGGQELVSGISVAANSTQFIDLDQVLYNSELLTASASASSVKLHIAGYEV